MALCNSPGCTGTCFVDQVGLEPRELHLPLSGLDKYCGWKYHPCGLDAGVGFSQGWTVVLRALESDHCLDTVAFVCLLAVRRLKQEVGLRSAWTTYRGNSRPYLMKDVLSLNKQEQE